MKTFKVLALFFLCAILMTGCGFVEKLEKVDLPPLPTIPTESEKTASESSEEQTEDETVIVSGNHVLVTYDSVNHICYDPQLRETQLLDYYAESVQMELPENPAAEEKINEKLQEINASYLPSEDGVGTEMDKETYLQSLAEDYYSSNASGTVEISDYLFRFTRLCEVKFTDSAILVSFENNLQMPYEGTPEVTEEDYIFDTATGDFMEIAASGSQTFGNGYIRLLRADEQNPDHVPIISLLSLDEEGDDYVLCATGAVCNLKLSNAVLHETAAEAGACIWQMNYLCNEGVQIRANLTENMEYILSYDTEGGEENYVICLKDQNICLQPADNLNSLG